MRGSYFASLLALIVVIAALVTGMGLYFAREDEDPDRANRISEIFETLILASVSAAAGAVSTAATIGSDSSLRQLPSRREERYTFEDPGDTD